MKQIVVFIICTVSGTACLAADIPGYVSGYAPNQLTGVVEPLTEWRKTTLPELPYNQHVRKQRRSGIRHSNRHPGSFQSTFRSQFAQQRQIPVFSQSSQFANARKNIVDLKQTIVTPRQSDLRRSGDKAAESEKVEIKSADAFGLQQRIAQLPGDFARSNSNDAEPESAKSESSDVIELRQTIEKLEGDLARSNNKIVELENAQFESSSIAMQRIVERLQADLSRSMERIAQLEKAKTELKLSVKQAEQARASAEDDKRQIEQVRNREVDAKTRFWRGLAYTAIACLLTFALGFGLWFLKERKISRSQTAFGREASANQTAWSWGDVSLQSLDDSSIGQVAAGKSLNAG